MRLARLFLSVCLCLFSVIVPLSANAEGAEERAYIQVSSHPTLKQAVRAASGYVEAFPDLEIYSTSTGAFALSVASVEPDRATVILQSLKASGLIPQEALYTPGYDYLTKEWWKPSSIQPTSRVTLAAIASEKKWSESVRRGVQNALLWAGDYVTRIDGGFGPSTRRAIKLFQMENGFAPTGFLTSAQIEILEAIRTKRVAETGFQIVADEQVGMSIGLPLRYFSQYDAEISEGGLFKTLNNAPGYYGRNFISLISHELAPGQLYGLYETVAGLSLVPAKSYRVFKEDWFVVSGTSDGISLYAYVRQFGNEAKGFLITWDTRDTDIYRPISMAMFNSLENIAGLNLERYVSLHPQTPPATVSTPTVSSPAPSEPEPPEHAGSSSGTGFFVNADGYLVTNQHVIAGCTKSLSVDGQPASVVVADEKRDLAVLFMPSGQGTRPHASFAGKPIDLNADVTVVGYPLQGILQGLNVTRGSVSGLYGLLGDTDSLQITAPVQPGNSGGPLLDEFGNVVGVVQSKLDAIKAIEITGDLPQNVNFAIRGQTVLTFLSQNSIAYDVTVPSEVLAPTALAARARGFTAFIVCE